MANICLNRFFLSNEDNEENFLKIKHKFIDILDSELDGEFTYEGDDDFIEGWFESRWTFPSKIMEELIPKGTEGIHFRCLSEEYGNEYVAMNVFKDGEWWGEQTFEL